MNESHPLHGRIPALALAVLLVAGSAFAADPPVLLGPFEGILAGGGTIRLGDDQVEVKTGRKDAVMIAFDPAAPFFKLIALSGSPTVKRTGRFGEKQWLRPGQTIFGDPTDDTLPAPVTVHLPTLVASSPGLQRFLDDPGRGIHVVRADGATLESLRPSLELNFLAPQPAGTAPFDPGVGLSPVDPDLSVGRGQRELVVPRRETGKSLVPLGDLIRASKRQNQELGTGNIIGPPIHLAGPGAELRPGNGTYLTDEEVSSLLKRAARAASPGGDAVLDVVDIDPGAEGARLLDQLTGNSVFTFQPFQVPTSRPSIDTVAGDVSGYIPTDVISVSDGERYQVWRDSFGRSVDPGEEGDFNRDGVVDASDYTVWRDTANRHDGSLLEATPGSFEGDTLPAGDTLEPGFVPPIRLGGPFFAGTGAVPSSDLFAIDHTNRDRLAPDGGGTDRFNPVIPTYQIEAFTQLKIPESHGFDTRFPASTSRGIDTLPDGTEIFPDSTPVGGIGVTFPVQPGGGTNYRIDSTSVIEVNRVLTASYPTLAATNLGFFRTYEANGNLLVTGAVDDFTNAGNTYASLLFQSSGNLDLDNAVVDTTNASFVPIAPGIGFQTTGGNLRVVDSTIDAPNNVGILLDNRSGGTLLVESSTLVSDRAVTVSNQLDENNQPTNGTVTLRGADIDAPQQINLQSGGDLDITGNGAPTTIDGNSILAQSFSGGVRIASSSDLNALTDLILQASSNGDVVIDNSTLQAGNQLLIEAIRPNNPLLRIDGSTLHANVIRARALGNGAVVRVNGANLTAIIQLNLFADGANSLLHFTGNTTLTSPVLNLAGQEVRIDSGASVTTSTAPNVFTNQPNYNQAGFGSFSQPPNTQPYNSRPGF